MTRFLLSPLIGISLLLSPLTSFAANYFVTSSGGGNRDGTSWPSARSIDDFNRSNVPTGGDTVIFSGNFTSPAVPGSNGTGNDAGRLTLDLTGATLYTSGTAIQINARSYLTVNGGVIGSSYSGLIVNFNPNNGGISHDITLNGLSYTGQANGVAVFLSLNHVYNLVVSNCIVDNVSAFVAGDSTLNHDIDITGCYAGTSTDTTEQDDLIHIGDAANITIEGCKLIGRAPADPAERHNDVIQNYIKGGSNAGSPTNWVIRYNWIEMQQTSGSGDCSWIMFQGMGGDPALKIYGNVFIGNGTVSNNGILVSRDFGGSYYFHNNTVIRHGAPENTVRFLDSGTLHAENNVGMADAFAHSAFVGWLMADGGWDFNFFYQASNASPFYAGPDGSPNIDPLFIDYAGSNFSLTTTSPLRGRGDNLGAEYNQGIAFGSTWPNPTLTTRSTWDVGAFNQ